MEGEETVIKITKMKTRSLQKNKEQGLCGMTFFTWAMSSA